MSNELTGRTIGPMSKENKDIILNLPRRQGLIPEGMLSSELIKKIAGVWGNGIIEKSLGITKFTPNDGWPSSPNPIDPAYPRYVSEKMDFNVPPKKEGKMKDSGYIKRCRSNMKKLIDPNSNIYIPTSIWEDEQLFHEISNHANFFRKIAPVILRLEEKDPYTMFYITDPIGRIATGMAITSTMEQYNRKTGIELAVQRAIKAFKAKMNLVAVRNTIDEFSKEFTIEQMERVINAPYSYHCNYEK